MMPARLPSASVMPTQPNPLLDISTTASAMTVAEASERNRVAGMHQVGDEFQHGAEPAAGMQLTEIERGKAAAFQKRDSERIAQPRLHQGGGGGSEVVRAGLRVSSAAAAPRRRRAPTCSRRRR